jgi:hypothetical protein
MPRRRWGFRARKDSNRDPRLTPTSFVKTCMRATTIARSPHVVAALRPSVRSLQMTTAAPPIVVRRPAIVVRPWRSSFVAPRSSFDSLRRSSDALECSSLAFKRHDSVRHVDPEASDALPSRSVPISLSEEHPGAHDEPRTLSGDLPRPDHELFSASKSLAAFQTSIGRPFRSFSPAAARRMLTSPGSRSLSYDALLGEAASAGSAQV